MEDGGDKGDRCEGGEREREGKVFICVRQLEHRNFRMQADWLGNLKPKWFEPKCIRSTPVPQLACTSQL